MNNLIDRLLKKRNIDQETKCWNWTGCIHKFGYGVIRVNKKTCKVHRVSANLFLNFNPDSGLCVLHKCDNRKCFNPDHLFIGTYYDNNLDCKLKGRKKDTHGMGNPNCKLSDEMISEIRKKLNQGYSQTELSKIYKVAQATIWKIKNKIRWSHI